MNKRMNEILSFPLIDFVQSQSPDSGFILSC